MGKVVLKINELEFIQDGVPSTYPELVCQRGWVSVPEGQELKGKHTDWLRFIRTTQERNGLPVFELRGEYAYDPTERLHG